MNILDIFFKKNNKQEEITPVDNYLNNFFFDENGLYNPYNSLKFYSNVAPVNVAINTIANSYLSIPLKIHDKKNNTYIEENSFLNLLKNPNDTQQYHELLNDLIINYLATGNAFLMVTYGFNNKPLELFSLSPINISAIGIIKDNPIANIPQSYIYTAENYTKTFNYNNGEYVSSDNLSKLYHLKDFVNNSVPASQSFFGMSKIHSILRESQIYSEGNLANLSAFKKGMAGQLALISDVKADIDPDLRKQLKKEIEKYSGSRNKGKIPFLYGGLSFQELGKSNVDMEYCQLQKNTIMMIASIFKVPLALMLDSTMTMNNLEVARLHLDNDTVIPLSNKINSMLTKAVLNTNDDLEFKFNISSIPSKRSEEIQTALNLSKLNAITINEVRQFVGYDNIDGGDQIITTSFLQSGNDDMQDKLKLNGLTDKEIQLLSGLVDDDNNY